MMLHPATVHFAMVLPLVSAVIGAIYLSKRNEGMGKLSSFAIVMTAIAVGVVWYTGNHAGPKIYRFLSEAGKHELLEHKALGLYIAIAMGIIAVVKVLGCKMKKFSLEVVAILATFIVAGTVFVQGKHGGEIVYEYGEPFKAHKMVSTFKEAVATADDTEECDEKVEAYEDAADTIDGIDEDVNDALGIDSKKANGEEEKEEE